MSSEGCCIKLFDKSVPKDNHVTSGNLIEPDPLPAYYSDHLSYLIEPMPTLAHTLSYSPIPVSKSIMKLIDKSEQPYSLKMYVKILEYAGDAVGNENPGSSKVANEIIETILSAKFIYMPDEAILYCIKQLTNSSESALKNYINLLMAVYTFICPVYANVRKFMRRFFSEKLNDPTFAKLKKELEYLSLAASKEHKLCSYCYEIDSSDWAIKHVTNGSFFHKPLAEQIELQKEKYSNFVAPWALIQILHAINQVPPGNMNTIIREASETKDVTKLRYSLDNFRNITLTDFDPRIFMALLLSYILYSRIIPVEVVDSLIEFNLANKDSDGKEAVDIIKRLPKVNYIVFCYIIKMFKEKFLSKCTEGSFNSTMKLLSSHFFNKSSLPRFDNTIALLGQTPTIFRKLYDNLDIDEVEIME